MKLRLCYEIFVCCLPLKCVHATFNLFQVMVLIKLQCGYIIHLILKVPIQLFQYSKIGFCKSQGILLGLIRNVSVLSNKLSSSSGYEHVR